MTEAEWLTSDDPTAMYTWLRPGWTIGRRPVLRMSNRAAALFATACVHATPQAAAHPFLLKAAHALENSAEAGDRTAIDALAAEASHEISEAVRIGGLNSPQHFWALAALRLTDNSILDYAFHIPLFILKAIAGAANEAELRACYANRLRDIVGNPFRGGRGKRMKRPMKTHNFPVLADRHVSSDALLIAHTMYESRDFSAMPILADALQDAGCDNDDILAHCRGMTGGGSGEPAGGSSVQVTHVRGCWVVDLVLGKE